MIPEAQTGNALNNIIKGQQEAFALGIQLEIAKALKEQLAAQNKYELLPANVGIDNESVNELVNSYNTMLSQRNSLLVSTTEQSPVIQQLSSQLEQAKAAIITGVNRYIEGLEVSQKNYRQMENQTRGLVASLPTKENTLRGYARNFKIVEELYVFLLQRKEEASISYISALPNLKVLSYGVSGRATHRSQRENHLSGGTGIGTPDSFWSFVPDQTLGYQNQYPGRSRTRTEGDSVFWERYPSMKI